MFNFNVSFKFFKIVELRKCFENHIVVRSMENVALALMLCCEKLRPDSMWHAYINILPIIYDTPLFYELDEMKVLLLNTLYPFFFDF